MSKYKFNKNIANLYEIGSEYNINDLQKYLTGQAAKKLIKGGYMAVIKERKKGASLLIEKQQKSYIFKSGKYKGKTFFEIKEKDFNYLLSLSKTNTNEKQLIGLIKYAIRNRYLNNIPEYTFKTGIHKDKSLADVKKNYPQYLLYLFNNKNAILNNEAFYYIEINYEEIQKSVIIPQEYELPKKRKKKKEEPKQLQQNETNISHAKGTPEWHTIFKNNNSKNIENYTFKRGEYKGKSLADVENIKPAFFTNIWRNYADLLKTDDILFNYTYYFILNKYNKIADEYIFKTGNNKGKSLADVKKEDPLSLITLIREQSKKINNILYCYISVNMYELQNSVIREEVVSRGNIANKYSNMTNITKK